MRKQPLANTSAICEKIDALYEFKAKNWYNFNGDAYTFISLQKELSPEREMLHRIWGGNEDHDGRIKRCGMWNCEQAFYDTPISYRFHTHNVPWNLNKWDILQDRYYYLDQIHQWISSLFHDWQFAKYGWTAY